MISCETVSFAYCVENQHQMVAALCKVCTLKNAVLAITQSREYGLEIIPITYIKDDPPTIPIQANQGPLIPRPLSLLDPVGMHPLLSAR